LGDVLVGVLAPGLICHVREHVEGFSISNLLGLLVKVPPSLIRCRVFHVTIQSSLLLTSGSQIA
jgi:hypothetical protein